MTRDRDTRRHSLTVPSVGEEDFANYSCEATNSLGKARAMVQLRGNPGPPQFSGQVGPVREWRVFYFDSFICAGPVCEEKLLPAGVADTQLPADTAVQAAVAQGGGRQPQIMFS